MSPPARPTATEAPGCSVWAGNAAARGAAGAAYSARPILRPACCSAAATGPDTPLKLIGAASARTRRLSDAAIGRAPTGGTTGSSSIDWIGVTRTTLLPESPGPWAEAPIGFGTPSAPAAPLAGGPGKTPAV